MSKTKTKKTYSNENRLCYFSKQFIHLGFPSSFVIFYSLVRLMQSWDIEVKPGPRLDRLIDCSR